MTGPLDQFNHAISFTVSCDTQEEIGRTLALSVDERVAWLEQMMAIAMDSGALPKRVPDRLAGAKPPR